jgi:hypothetical protein
VGPLVALGSTVSTYSSGCIKQVGIIRVILRLLWLVVCVWHATLHFYPTLYVYVNLTPYVLVIYVLDPFEKEHVAEDYVFPSTVHVTDATSVNAEWRGDLSYVVVSASIYKMHITWNPDIDPQTSLMCKIRCISNICVCLCSCFKLFRILNYFLCLSFRCQLLYFNELPE